MRESSFWTHRVRPLLHGENYCERIENGIGSGTPDVFFVGTLGMGWIENKYRKELPGRSSTIVFPNGLRPAQQAWWLRYLRFKGKGVICVGVERYSFVLRATPNVVNDFNFMTWERLKCFPPLTKDELTFALL